MIKRIISFLLNLIMSILVLGLICVILITNTIYNKDYIKLKLKENKFYSRTYSDIKNDFENYTMQSGLDLEILDGLISEEKVEKDINSKIDYIYGGEKVEIETASIRNEIDSRIKAALEKNHRTPTNSEKNSISKYEDVLEECYKTGILYGKDFALKNIGKYLNIAKNSCIIGIIVISIILLIINKSLLKYLTYVGVNLLFSGSLCILLRFLLENRVDHILLLDQKFSNLLVNTILEIINKFHKVGSICVIASIICIIVGSFEKKKKTIENKKD